MDTAPKVQNNTLVISDKIYTPIRLIPNIEDVKEEYTKHFYIDANCRKCEYRIDKRGSQPGPMCESCESHTDVVKLWSRSSFDGCDYLALPLGDKAAYERKTGVLFSEVKIRDERVRAPFQYPIEFTAKLYDYQQEMANQWLRKKYGLVEAPPRTGKTLTMLYICLQLGQRVLLLASQHEFLDQFLDHIHGNPEEGIPKCTNLPELEKKYKRKLYGYPETDEDYENFQFMVSTPNQFYSKTNGERRFNLVVMNCGTLAIDECFPGDYRIRTTSGLVPISEVVETGTSVPVLSYNFYSNKAEFRPSISVTRKRVRKLCKVVIDGVTYKSTPNHEYWVTGRGFVAACDLKPGDTVILSGVPEPEPHI